jgi:3-oxo-5-alpha-steroid 4-dehydrogenase 1
MTEATLFEKLVVVYPILAVIVAIFLHFITVPYGRHNEKPSKSWGPQIGSRAGWLFMEVPASLLPIAFVAIGGRFDVMVLVFLLIWQAHYAHRAFVFPFRRRGGVATMPFLIALMGLVFNLFNTYLNWRYLTRFGPRYDLLWLVDPRFFVGVIVFFVGLGINQHADAVLINLRKPGETGYKIPYGGLYRQISCPNYFGELLTWCGWALLTWSIPGLIFVVWSAANLIPRALAHHRDYKKRFPNYPPERRAIIPYVL